MYDSWELGVHFPSTCPAGAAEMARGGNGRMCGLAGRFEGVRTFHANPIFDRNQTNIQPKSTWPL